MTQDRLGQLLGVVSLAVGDRVRDAIEHEAGGGSAPAALVHLQAWPGGSLAELGDVLGISQPATVRLVERLVDRGLVVREQGRDGRTRALSCTPAGQRAANALLDARAAGVRPLLAPLDAGERTALEQLLERVVAGLADDRAEVLTTCRLCDRDACQGGRDACPLNHAGDR